MGWVLQRQGSGGGGLYTLMGVDMRLRALQEWKWSCLCECVSLGGCYDALGVTLQPLAVTCG